jgi:hypothetical protein
MKRRDFLATAALAGAGVPALLRAASRPCPPPTLAVQGGQSVSTPCGNANANADWLARSTGPGVMWAHNFDSAAEVGRFRFDNWGYNDVNNNDPTNTVTWQPDGFAGGGCVQIAVPTGGTANGGWMRPFQALPGDRGYTSGPDWVGQYIGSASNWQVGYYGHSSYHDTSTNVINGIVTPTWAGTDFYIQCRVKISASRFSAGNPDGKLIFLGVTNLTPDQEVVVRSVQQGFWSVYTNFGSRNNSTLYDPQDGGSGPYNSLQPGGAYATTCGPGGPNPGYQSPGFCYYWPPDTWVTMLIHMIPGLQGGVGTPGNISNVDYSNTAAKNTGIQVWIAGPGQTSYTKIWDKQDYIWSFDPAPYGWNMFEPSAYMNNAPSAVGWTHRYTQVIFSKQFIPNPQV